MSVKIYPPALKTLRDPIISGPIKSFWAPESKVESPYTDLVPDVPDPSVLAIDREKIISDGTIPRIMPAALGLRAWLAERRIDRHQKTAETLLGRKAKVAAFVGRQIINQVGYQGFDEEFRPQSPAEKIMAWRMHAKWHKATVKNTLKNNIAAQYRVITRVPKEEEKVQIDFEKNLNHASFTEKGRANKSKRQHAWLGRQANILMHGRTVPVITKNGRTLPVIGKRRINGFEQFANKAATAIEKRDKAIRKAEAIRRKRAARSFRVKRSFK